MKRLAASIIIGLVLGALIAYQLIPTPDTSEYEVTITQLQQELDTKQTTIDTLNERITSLESELEETRYNLSQMNDWISYLESQLYQNQDPTNETIHTGTGIVNITDPIKPPKVVYQLQNYDLEALADAEADMYIIDYSWEGDEETRFTSMELNTIRSTPDTEILAYLSIGEAEDYRWYWQSNWDSNPPSWLGDTNPKWMGNYKVRYWEPEWQNIVYEYLDKALDSGFDGVYLDIIDAYEYWGPDGESGIDRETTEQEMVDFVIAISQYTKATNPDFKVYPQNGEALGTHPEYLAAIDGIGREDVWYNDNQPQNDTETTLTYLTLFSEAGKHIIVIDYPTEETLILDFITRAEVHGYSWYPGNRQLDTISAYID